MQGYGYNVEYLYNEIAKILGIDRQNSMIIIGGGHFGQTIANYGKFEQRGFVTKAIFDVSPERIGQTVRGIMTYSMDSCYFCRFTGSGCRFVNRISCVRHSGQNGSYACR